ncbi:MAG TPA: nitroreductase family protein, partial [Rhodocyclaceae bacterium]|nr:nitroreductase family protein [Rhodocyclaceae bacterium]
MNQTALAASVLEAIQKRRSVRDYSPQRLDGATVEGLLAAAVRAPTAMHAEPWRFIVIQDLPLLGR